MTMKLRDVLEQLVILVGILAFWPAVFGHTGLVYQLALVSVVVALAVLAFIRFRRIREAVRKELEPGSRPR